MQNKECKMYAIPGSDRCLVKLQDMYLEKLTPGSQHLYMRPLPEVLIDDGPWYTRQGVGINTFKCFLSKLCNDSGIETSHTNYSLRATSITRMHNGNILEKVIAEKSGHKSIKGLERTSVEQQQTAGHMISGFGEPKKQQIKEETSTDSRGVMVKTKSESNKPKSESNPIHAFSSGILNNCTINISYNQ